MICHVVALLFLTAGGSLTTKSNEEFALQSRIDVMIAGLFFQVASLMVFAGLYYDFSWRVHHDCEGSKLQESHDLPFSVFKFHIFLHCKSYVFFANREFRY